MTQKIGATTRMCLVSPYRVRLNGIPTLYREEKDVRKTKLSQNQDFDIQGLVGRRVRASVILSLFRTLAIYSSLHFLGFSNAYVSCSISNARMQIPTRLAVRSMVQ